MCDRVINMLQTTKQSSSANLLNLLNHTSNPTVSIRRKPSSQSSSNGMSSPNTVKKFRAAWSETCDGEKLKQTMTATEIERQNVLYELFSEEQQMIENLGLAQRVRAENQSRSKTAIEFDPSRSIAMEWKRWIFWQIQNWNRSLAHWKTFFLCMKVSPSCSHPHRYPLSVRW